MNWIPKNLKELGQLADKLKAEKHPEFPPHALVKKKIQGHNRQRPHKDHHLGHVSRSRGCSVPNQQRGGVRR